MPKSASHLICTAAVLLSVVGVNEMNAPETNVTEHVLEVPDFRTTSYPQSDPVIDSFVEEYHLVLRKLLRQLSDSGHTNAQKTYAIYLVGQLRAVQAAPWLIEHIDFEADHIDPRSRIGRWSQYPAVDALNRLGVHASRRILQQLSEEEDPHRIHLMIRVVRQVEGIEGGRARVKRLLKGEIDPVKLKRLETALQYLSQP